MRAKKGADPSKSPPPEPIPSTSVLSTADKVRSVPWRTTTQVHLRFNDLAYSRRF